jgi:ribonuclease HII
MSGHAELSGLPLAEIRRRIAGSDSPDEWQRLAAALDCDPRRGARALAARLERRREAHGDEARRLAGLFALRRQLRAAGATTVAGVDEVGVGPLAGPVVAAAVVLPDRVDLPGLDDSKRLTATARERLDARIREQACAVAVAEVANDEIDRVNVLRAALLAMRRAVAALGEWPDHVLVDGRAIPDLGTPQTPLVGGDARDGSIAAASIVAKVYRDALMCGFEERYPGYGFARHKGYPTREHFACLARLGPSPIHRLSFAPVARVARR